MTISFDKNELHINGNRVSFLAPIDSVVQVENGVVVLLAAMTKQSEQNVFFVNPDGSVKWQIQHLGMPKEVGYQGYTYIGLDSDGVLEANNFRAVLCKVDMETGQIYNCVGRRD
jgi:hypothetical protein